MPYFSPSRLLLRYRTQPSCSAPFAVLCVLAVWLAACGVPGEPLPPLLEIPEPVRDLAVEQVGARVVLRFTRPSLTTEGTRVRFLNRLEIYGAFASADPSPPDFSQQGQLLAVLSGADLLAGEQQITHELPLAASQIGARGRFAVKAINHRGMDAGFSNIAGIEIVDLPQPPTALQATLTEQAIRLTWQPGERSAFNGAPPQPEGYEVFRSVAGSPAEAQMIGTSAMPSYEDHAFAFGTRFMYFVRAFARSGGAKAVTTASPPVEVNAVDRFPPAAPQNLRAIAVHGAVELAWSPNAEPDLAGYHLYRGDSGPFTRLSQELLTIPLYRDSAVAAGISYRYRVTAVDREGNESPSSVDASVVSE